MPVALVVLAGGESRRFQRPGEPRVDKCRYPVEGKPMIDRVVEAARAYVDEIYVAPGRNEGYDAPSIEDSPRFSGPLAAADSAAGRLGGTLLFAPCDVPFVTGRVFEGLLEAAGTAVYVSPEGLVESHVFKAEARELREALDLAAERGRRRIDDVFRLSRRVSYLSSAKRGVVRDLLNVNFREDLAAAPRRPRVVFDDDLALDWDPPLRRHLASGSPEPLWDELEAYLEAGLLSMAAHVLEDLSPSRPRLKAAADALKEWIGIRKLS